MNLKDAKNELSVLYSGIRDIELNEMINNLIKFFMVGIKNIYKTKNIMAGHINKF